MAEKLIPQIVQSMNYPFVILIISIVAIFAFRKPICGLIDRIIKGNIGPSSFDAPHPQAQTDGRGVRGMPELGKVSEPLNTENQHESTSANNDGARAFLQSFDNPLLKEVEDNIRADLIRRNINSAPDKEKVLIRALASAQVIMELEKIYASIWKSQIDALRYLNGQNDGALSTDLSLFYNYAKSSFPEWYEKQPYEAWLSYMTAFNLIQRKNENVHITVLGRQFLRYIVDAGKLEKISG